VLTLIVGVLVVAVATAGFGFSMFGRRPPLQPATADDASFRPAVETSRVVGSTSGRRRRRTRPTGSDGVPDAAVPRLQVEIPTAVRMRSAFILGLGVITAAALIGMLLSIIIVGGFTLIG